MPEIHRALDWLARRHAGESAALVAWRAGVSERVVLRATRDYGPFPRPTQQLGRVTVSNELLDERARRWIKERRAGHSVKDIAARSGVSHQLVSKATKDHGPFPAVDLVETWVAARRMRRSVAAISEDAGVPPAAVRRHTVAHGPFPQPAARLPEGVVGIAGVADLAGVSDPTVLRWRDTGRLPQPDFVTARGRSLWLRPTVERWLEVSGLEQCLECRARVVSLPRHRAAAH